MSLDQHAYRILCRLYRLVLLKQWMAPIVVPGHSSSAAGGQEAPGLERLEGRLLLSVAPALAEPAHVHFQGDGTGDSLYLRANHGVLEYSQTGLADSYIADLDPADGVQTLALTHDARIFIDLGDGENHLFVDASLNGALTTDGAVLTIQGGAGADTLHGPASQSDWLVAGQDAGTLNGQIHFTGVENLAGASGNNDTFRLAPGAGVTGLIDGGEGGFDSMVIDGAYGSAVYMGTGPHSGTIKLDGKSLQYDGLEPVTVGVVASLTVNGSSSDDDLVLRIDPGDLTKLQVYSIGATIESISFAVPTTSLTINGGLGKDSLTISGVVNLGSASLAVNAETIALGATTNLAAGVVTLTAAASLDLTTVDIVSALNSFHGSSVVDLAHLISDFLMGNVQTQINLTDATVTATSLSLSATTTVTGVTTGLLNSALSFTIPGFSAAFANVHAKADVAISGGSIATAAGLSLSAVSSVTTGATANASAGNTDTAVDGAFALSVVNSEASAVIGGAATLAVAGEVNVLASNTTSVTTTADGTAAGSSAAGGSIALAFVKPTTHAYIEGTVATPTTHPTSIDVTATSKTDVATTAKSTTKGSTANDSGTQGQLGGVDAKSSQGESGVSVAGAFALTDVTANNIAHAASSGAIVTPGALHVRAYNDTDSSAAADASFTGKDAPATGVGVAVAANVPIVHNEAHLSGPVTANGIEVDAQMNAADVDGKNVFAAKSTSGASGSAVGAAGSFAMNLVDSNASATLQTGGTINASGGNVLVQSANHSDENAEAAAKAVGGTKVGVGASVAMNIALNSVSEARVENGVAMSNVHDLTLSAGGDHTVVTKTDAGATGGVSVTPSVAVTTWDNDTTAALGTGTSLTIGGDLSVTATGKSNVSTEAKADAEADKVAVGASIGVTVANDAVTATSSRNLNVTGNATLEADSSATSSASASASAKGASKDDTEAAGKPAADDQANGAMGLADGKAPSKPAKAGTQPSAKSSDGKVGVAAAIAVNVAGSDSHAFLAGAATVTAGGALTLRSTNDTDATGAADGSATDTTTGVGVAVAVNYADIDNTAYIDDGQIVTAGGVAIEAKMNSTDGDGKHDLGATATAGAGATNVGVAGALALNLLAGQTEARIDPGANVTLTGGGDVQLTAVNTTASAVKATGKATGGKVGVGAAVALNIVPAKTTAQVTSGVALAGVHDLKVSATGAHTVTTTTESGAEGGTAISPAVGIAVVNSNTTAGVVASAGAAHITGALEVTALHTDTVATTVDASAAGDKVAVGAGVAVNVVTDTVLASVGGDLTADGNATITATSTVTAGANTTASAKGQSESGKDADTEANDQVNNNSTTAGAPLPKAKASTDQANSSASTQSGGKGSGGVGVAAAIGVNWVTANTTASVGVSGQLTANDVVLRATNETDAMAKGQGTALNGSSSTNVGAAVGLNVATVNSTAKIGDSAHVTGHNIAIEAVTPAGKTSDLTAWGLAAGGGKDTGAAGSLGVNVATTTTQASVGAGATVSASGDLGITARTDLGTQNIAGAGGIGKSVGVGIAIAANIFTVNTEAFIASGAIVDASGRIDLSATSSLSPLTLVLPLLPDPVVTSIAVGGGVTLGNAGVGGSAVVDVLTFNTKAHIDDSAHVNDTALAGLAQSISLTASSNIHLNKGAGALGVAIGTAGVGIGLDVTVLTVDTEAYIAPNAVVHTADDVLLSATATEDILTVAATAAGGGSAGVAGSIVVCIPLITVNARIGYVNRDTSISQGATVHAGGDVTLTASNNETYRLNSGGAAFGGSAGVGIAAVALGGTETVEAYVGAGSDIQTAGAAGLALTATNTQDIQAISVAGSGGGSAGVAGSANANVILHKTHAFIDGGTITAASGSSTNPGVSLTATDTTHILGLAGAITFGGSAGVGAGLDIGVINKETQAFIAQGTTVTAEGNVVISANSIEKITSVSAAGAGGGSAGIAGTAGVYVLTINTMACIGHDPNDAAVAVDTNVTADGNVVVAADDQTDLNVISGNVTASGSASVGGAVGVPIVTKTTKAFLGNKAKVTAKGVKTTSPARTGSYAAAEQNVQFKPSTAVSGNVINLGYAHGYTTGQAVVYYKGADTNITGLTDGAVYYAIVTGANTIKLATTRDNALAGTGIAINGAGQTLATHRITPAESVSMPSMNDPNLDAMKLTPQRSVNWETKNIRGVAVTATNRDRVAVAGVSGGASGSVSVNIGGVVDVTTNHTQAFIADGAQVNHASGNAGAHTDQSVLVGAGSDSYYLGIAGGLGASGSVAVTPSAAVLVFTGDTKAYIDDNTIINTKGDVLVTARSGMEAVSVSAGVALSGTVSVAGSVGVIVLSDTTLAYIGNDATTLGGGAHVDADGNVLISATDNTKVTGVVGSLGIGFGAVGVGAAVGVTTITKNTSAFVGDYATVNARGVGGTLSGILTSADPNADTHSAAFTTTSTFHGLAVQANSKEDLLTIAAAGAGGFYAGVAGGVSVEIVKSDTTATIGQYADINKSQVTANADPAQGINISAGNDTIVEAIGGALGIGIAGIGGGVDVGVVRNNTKAYVKGHAELTARGDVDVNSLSRKNVDTKALSVGGGLVGAAGSISVWTLGTTVSSTYNDNGGNNADAMSVSGADYSNIQGFTDAQANGGNSTNGYLAMLGGYSGGGDISQQRAGSTTGDASSAMSAAAPTNPAGTAIADAAAPEGTVAYVDSSASIGAGGNVGVVAKENVDFTGLAGAVAGGAAALGASIEIANIKSNTNAYIATGATVAAGNNVTVEAGLVEQAAGNAYAGTAGAVALGAQVVVIKDTSTQAAHIDNGANITDAGGEVKVAAHAVRDDSALAIGGSIAGVAAGVAVGSVTIGGSTVASMGSANIGQTGTVHNVTVQADSDVTADSQSYGVIAGLGGLAANGVVSLATVNPTVRGSIANGAHVAATGDVTVQSASQADADTYALGVAVSGVGATLGVSVADTQLHPVVEAYIGTGGGSAIVSGDGNIAVRGLVNTTYNPGTGVYTEQSGKGAGAQAIAGSGSLVAAISGAAAIAANNSEVKSSVGAGSTLDAGGDAAVIAKAYNDATTNAIGIAAAGLVGVGAPVATSTDGATTWAHLDGNVTSTTNLIVTADGHDTAKATTKAGTAGLLAGQINIAQATITADTKAYLASTADVDATGNVTVTGLSRAKGETTGLGLTVGWAALGAVVSKAVDNSTTSAYVAGGSVTAGGNVTVKSRHNVADGGGLLGDSAVAYGMAAGGGVLSGIGTDVKAIANGVTSTYVGGTISAVAGAVQVQTFNYNHASAEADGMVGGLVGVGVVLADAVSGAKYDGGGNLVSGVTEAYVAGSANVDAASLAVLANSVNDADAATYSGGIGGVAGTGATAKANVDPTIRAYIGGSAQVDVTGVGGVSVTALSAGDATGTAYAANLAGVAAGYTAGYATVASDVDAYTGGSAHVWATNGPIAIQAAHNMGLDGSTVGTGATASANAASAGIVSVQSAYAKADSKADVHAYTGGSSNVNAAGDVTVNALGRNTAASSVDGESFGVVGVGAVNADAYAGNSTTSVGAYLGDSSTTEGANVAVAAEHRANASSSVKQAAGGLITISGASADQYGNKAFANAQPTADAHVGASATVNTDADLTVRALARGSSDADSTGKNLGVVAVGKSIATAEWRPTVTAAINANADVNAGDDIAVQAYNNYDAAGSQLSDQTTADASNSAGGLIGASGSATNVNVDSYTRASLGGSAKLDAGLSTADGQIAVDALSHNNTWSKANGLAFGGVGIGGADAAVTVYNDALAQTDDGTSGNRTHLASDTLTELNAVSDNDGSVVASGVSGGVGSFGKANATFTLASNNTWATVGAYNEIQGIDSTFNVHASSYGTMSASATQDSTISGIAEAEAHGTVSATSGSTKASIGANTTANVAVIDIRSNDLGVDAQATAWANATVSLLYSDIRGTAKVDLRGNSEVFVATGASLTGYASLALVARQDAFRSSTTANARIGGGIAGQTIATSDNTIDANSKVTTQTGTFLTTKDLFVQALSPQTDNDWQQSATATSNTVIEWVWEVVGQTCTVVIEILTFGLADGEEVCEDVMGWVKHITQTAVDENYYGTETRTNTGETSVDFNSYVTVLGPPNPYLTIYADGSMDKSPNVTCTYDAVQNRWVVGDILNDSTGKVVIDSPPGKIVGNATFHYQDAFDRVDIVNNSDIDIEIHEISVWNQNKTDPDLKISVANKAGFTYNVTTSLGATIVDIENTGNSDVYFDDFVQNPLGTTIVHNSGASCDIFSVGYWGQIQSRIFEIVSDHGQIGTSTQRLILVAVQGDGLSTSITATANLGVYLSIKGIVTDGTPLVLNLTDVRSTTSDVDVLFPQGVAPNGATTTFWCAPCNKWRTTWVTTNVMETVDATIITAGGRIIGSAVNADVTGNVNVTGSGNVSFTTDGDIDLTETVGDLRVGRITSTAGDITLASAGANIVDANADSAADVTGAHLTLNTPAGGIGTQANPLDINSDLLTVAALNSVYVAETAGDLTLDEVHSLSGGAALRALAGSILGVDDATTDIHAIWAALYASAGIGAAANALDTIVSNLEGHAAIGGAWVSNTGVMTIGGAINDLAGLSASGAVVVTTHSPLTVDEDTTGATVTLTATDSAGTGDNLQVTAGATVQAAAGDVELRGGDNVTVDAGTTVQASGTVNVRVDYGNADAGVGGEANLYGSLIGAAAAVYGNADNDTVRLTNQASGTPTTIRTYAGDDTVVIHAAGAMTDVFGGDGDDTLEADTLPTMTTSVAGVRDSVNLDGQGDADAYIVRVTGGTTDYLVNVFDTGASGTDVLTAYGTALADDFLLRASQNDYPTGVAFVAALHGTPVAQVERVNYNKQLENLVVDAGAGNDNVTLDDNWALTTIRGGAGEDHFQVGQIFKTQRDAAASLAAADVFSTILTTRGYLSNGVSYVTTIEGNTDNDTFVVFHNTAALNLFGGAGDDLFIVRAFALEGSHTTDVTGEGGADYVEYVSNGLVTINGGDGTDTVRIIGTEFSDSVVVTNAGLFGMGLTVSYSEIEVLEIDLAEGNDTFYVWSTNTDVITRLFGGLGSDRFVIGGDVPDLMSGSTIIFPAAAGPHTTDGIQGTLEIDGAAGAGSAGGLSTPVMLPGETNVLPTIGQVVSYTGAGLGGQTDTMVVPTSVLNTYVADNALSGLSDLIGKTIEIGAGPGLNRFWMIRGLTVNGSQTTLSVENPGQPAAEWALPDSTSRFAITHLVSNFFVVESTQVDFATVYNDGSTTNDSGALTATDLTGLNMGPDGIAYANLEALDIFLGSGDDTFDVTGTMTREDGFQTITMLSTGDGADDVTASLTAGMDGLFSVNGEAGNDVIDGSASTLPLVMFGGEDDDTLTGGSGNDILFGDRGRVDYRDGTGKLITRLGLGLDERTVLQPGQTESSVTDVPFQQTDLTVRGPYLATTRDATTGGSDAILGGDGDDLIFGGAGGDFIGTDSSGTPAGAENGHDAIVGDNGSGSFDSDGAGILRSVQTSDSTVGGNDTVFGGADADVILGNAGDDTLSGGEGDDFILGDNGQAEFDATGLLTSVGTTNPADGGSDTIHGGDEVDTILGGAAGDTLYGDADNDVILGDNGTADIDQAGLATLVQTSDPSIGGSDTIYGGEGGDRIAGGADGDTIHGGLGDDVILGDSGVFNFAVDENHATLDQAQTSDPSIGGSDTIYGDDGADIILGGAAGDTIYGDGGASDGDDLILGDNGIAVFDGLVRVYVATTAPSLGGADTLEGNEGNDIILGGAGDDTIYGEAADPAGMLAGDDVILGDNGRVDYDLASDTILGRLDVSGITCDGVTGTLDRVMTTDPTIGGNDTIYGNGGDDVAIGGTGDDTIRGDTSDMPHDTYGSDVLMGDHAKYFPALDWGQNTFAIDTGADAGAGNDTVYGNGGDDFIFGQQGDDFLYGGTGEDDMTGGSNVIGAVDGGAYNDFMDGGDGADVMLGDNALILRHLLDGETRQWTRWPDPFADVIREVTRYDDIDAIGGNDTMYGGAGDDIMYGQRGDDAMYAGDGDDEVIGGLGNDTMSGGAGRDFMLGDQGYFIRTLNANGSARIDADGSFHRDCFLEDVGTITGLIPLDTTALRTFDPQLAAKITLADMTVISGVYNAGGGKQINTDTGAWDTEGMLIDLVAANNDTMDGGADNDFMVGQRGDDTISGGAGDDEVIGDQITNVSPFRTDIPQVIQGVRLIAADSTVPVALNRLGSVIVPQVTVYPEELNNFSLPVLTSLTPMGGELLDVVRNSSLDRTDGTTMTPYIAVVPDVVHHQDVLPGNDTLYGNEGNDTVVGDNAVFYAPLLTGMVELDKAIADMSSQLIGLTHALHGLSLDFDVYEHQVLGLSHAHDVVIGHDVIEGGEGNDMLFGDNGMFASAFMTGLPTTGTDFVAQAVAFHARLADLRDMTVDLGFVVQEARLQVLTDLTADALAKNPGKVKLAPKDIHDPAYHTMYLNCDVISTGSGDDLTFGDDAMYFTPAVTGETYAKPTEYLNVAQATYKAAQKAVKLQAKLRDAQLAEHVKTDHATAAEFRSRLPATTDLALVTFPYEYSRYVGNDSLTGGTGNSLMEADIAVVTMPVIVTAPATPKEFAQAGKDARAIANLIKTYVGQITTQHTGPLYFDKGAGDFNDRRQAGSDPITFAVANDTIVGGTGMNTIFGGGLFHTVPFNPFGDFTPEQLKILGTFNAEMPSLQENRRAAMNSLNGQKLTKVFANDLVTVNGTADSIFGGGGKNTIVFGPGALLIKKTSGSVPDVKTAGPMQIFTLSSLTPTFRTTALGLSAALTTGDGSENGDNGIFMAMFL